MMLKDPFVNEKFEPDLMWFIGVFNIYDQEETFGVELEKYDPNKKSDREVLIKKHSLKLDYLSHRHKFVLVKYLAHTLSDKNFDFDSVFEIGEDEASSWPRGEWYELENSRVFFEEVYSFAQDVWKNELYKASLEDQSDW